MQRVIEWAEFTDVHVASSSSSEQDIPWINSHIFITWQDECQLIFSHWEIIATTICGWIQVKCDLLTTIGRQVICELQSLFVDMSQLIVTKEHIMQSGKGGMI